MARKKQRKLVTIPAILFIVVLVASLFTGCGNTSGGYDAVVDSATMADSEPGVSSESEPQIPGEPDNLDPTIELARPEFEMTHLLRPEYAPKDDSECKDHFHWTVYWHNATVRAGYDHTGGWFQLKDDKVILISELHDFTIDNMAEVTRLGMPSAWLDQKDPKLGWRNTYATVNDQGYAQLHHTYDGISVDMPIWLVRIEVNGESYYKIFKEVCANLISPVEIFTKDNPTVVAQPDSTVLKVTKTVLGRNYPSDEEFQIRVSYTYNGEKVSFTITLKPGKTWSKTFANAKLLTDVKIEETWDGGRGWSHVETTHKGNSWTVTNRYKESDTDKPKPDKPKPTDPEPTDPEPKSPDPDDYPYPPDKPPVPPVTTPPESTPPPVDTGNGDSDDAGDGTGGGNPNIPDNAGQTPGTETGGAAPETGGTGGQDSGGRDIPPPQDGNGGTTASPPADNSPPPVAEGTQDPESW